VKSNFSYLEFLPSTHTHLLLFSFYIQLLSYFLPSTYTNPLLSSVYTWTSQVSCFLSSFHTHPLSLSSTHTHSLVFYPRNYASVSPPSHLVTSSSIDYRHLTYGMVPKTGPATRAEHLWCIFCLKVAVDENDSDVGLRIDCAWDAEVSTLCQQCSDIKSTCRLVCFSM